MTVKEVSKITGISAGRIESQIRRGLLPATSITISRIGTLFYIVKADDVYEFSRNEWFSASTPMLRPADIAGALLAQYEDELSETVRVKLRRMQYEDEKPRRERKETREETHKRIVEGA